MRERLAVGEDDVRDRVGADVLEPIARLRRPSSSSRRSGFGWISVWPVEHESNRKPGSVSSSVEAAPPATGRASSTRHLEARLREVRGGDEAVVPSARDDDVHARARAHPSRRSRCRCRCRSRAHVAAEVEVGDLRVLEHLARSARAAAPCRSPSRRRAWRRPRPMRTFCSTSRIVLPASFITRTLSNTAFSTFGSSPSDGSSSRTSFGSIISERANSTWRRCPPERLPGALAAALATRSGTAPPPPRSGAAGAPGRAGSGSRP